MSAGGTTKATRSELEAWLEGFLRDPGFLEAYPYYAAILAPGSIETKGGPKVNPSLQVLDGTETPVPGLYGVGNCMASPSGQAYWSGGTTWGPYVTFGFVAAKKIVAEPVKRC